MHPKALAAASPSLLPKQVLRRLQSERADLSTTEKAVKDAAAKAGRPEPQLLSLKLDITSKESVEAAAAKVKTVFGGRLDILINNAGVLAGRAPVAASDPDAWWSNFQANLLGPYLTCRSFLPLMGPGAIVFSISSVGAHCITPELSAYQTSKLAVLRLTEFLAVENPDVTSIVLHPGNMLTDIVGKGEGMDENLKAVFTETTDLCADGLTFLAGQHSEGDGIGWLSGRYVNVTWDLPELVGPEKRKEIVDGDKLKVRLVV